VREKLNIETWNRKEHFLFFKQMEEPFYGLTTTVDCTQAYDKAKTLGVSFFTYYLHKTLIAINSVENLRYRIIGEEVFIYDRIDVSATIMREDTTFGFSFIEFAPDLTVFAQNTAKEIERIQNTTGLFTREFNDPNLIHFSTLPWVNFTSVSHARGFNYPDSCPKISFGKMMEENGIKTMAISIHVHHALVDGFHVGQFIDSLQELLS
jgi:chloramphenicol O-acetyltransferase type A